MITLVIIDRSGKDVLAKCNAIQSLKRLIRKIRSNNVAEFAEIILVNVLGSLVGVLIAAYT